MWVCYWKILITIEKILWYWKKPIDNQYNTITEKNCYWTSININILIDIEKYWTFQYFSIDADPYSGVPVLKPSRRSCVINGWFGVGKS